ncbi:MAG: type II toxin-antitoxin system VapC family toxin [Acidimicrobiaceae bacterium]|nr:type II toxin-antitoxin system VapC family toxin [Acidimicrobiaceae bacterium]
MSGDLWFLDASAFLKLLVVEPESAELRRWAIGRRLASSDLLRTEARRGVAQMEASVSRDCEEHLAGVHKVRLTPALLDRAGRLPGHGLRTLDAIYVASALQLGDELADFVSYDRRQLAAAERLGLRTVSPGAA